MTTPGVPGVPEFGAPEPNGPAPGAPVPLPPEFHADLPAEPAGQPASTEPNAPTATAGIDWRRLHPLSPLLRGGIVLIIVAGIIIANFRDRLFGLFIAQEILDEMGPSEGDLIDYIVAESLVLVAMLVVLGAIVLIVVLAWISWRFNTFRITTEAVEERSGVLFRQHRRAPLDRIQSVNLQRPLLARLVGLTAVDVQTGGQGGKVSLRYLGHGDAKEVRERILLKVAEQRDVQAAARGARVAVDPSGRAYGETATPLDARIHDLADFDIDPAAREAGTLVKVPFGRLIGSILLGSEMMVIAFFAVMIVVATIWVSPFMIASALPLVLVFIGVIISLINRGFNFVLSRSSDGVRVGAGLTATTTETVPFGRIHAIEARQPIGWRPFGWWKVRITTAGHAAAQGGQNRLQNTVLPVGRIDDVIRVFETVLPGEPTPERDAALVDALMGPGTGFLRAGRRSAWVLWFGRRRAGIRLDSGEHATLRIRRGALNRSLGVLPIVRTQSIQLRRPLAHRALGLASIQAHTVLGPVTLQMRGLALGDAQRFFDDLALTVVRVQAAEPDGGVRG